MKRKNFPGHKNARRIGALARLMNRRYRPAMNEREAKEAETLATRVGGETLYDWRAYQRAA